MKHLGRNFRAISPVLAVLMMIAVAIAGSLVVYAWVMGYIGLSTEKSGESITIQSVFNEGTDLLVYVQNTGEGAVQLDEDNCLYINGIVVNCAISGVTVSDGMGTLNEGNTATLRYVGGAALPGEKIEVKVTTLNGTPAEKSAYPAGIANGQIMWDQTYGGTEREIASSLIQTSDGGYAVVGYKDDFPFGVCIWMVKTDAFGNVEWNQTYEGGSYCKSVIETSDGGYALAGITDSVDGGHDFYLVKTDASGNMIWNKTYGGPENDDAYSLVATSDGGYAIAGGTFSFGAGNEDFWLVKTDASGNMEWNRTYGGTNGERPLSLVVTSDGGYAIAGHTNSMVSVGHLRCWLVKTDGSGNAEWGEVYEGAGQGVAYSLVATSDGGYIIAGRTRASDVDFNDFWLIKTNASGYVEWEKTYGEEDQDNQVYSVVATSDGGYAFVGDTLSFFAENSGCWLVKTDGSGNMEWYRIYRETAYALVATSDGGYAIAGGRNNDFWLMKTDSLGNIE